LPFECNLQRYTVVGGAEEGVSEKLREALLAQQKEYEVGL
jgi:hypothetical protein